MESAREPHSVSVKVLRLSRPAVSESFQLPLEEGESTVRLSHSIARDIQDTEHDKNFVLGPMLTLPPAFGTAYVGETFACTLCANNELAANAEYQISNVRLGAEMQAPTGTVALDLLPDKESDQRGPIRSGESLQKMIRFDLREEGNHTLAVNLSYTETRLSQDLSASGGRIRSYRKLYQFIVTPCLNVRTKVSVFAGEDPQNLRSLALEAQLDNVADGPLMLKSVHLIPKPAFTATSLNWDALCYETRDSTNPILLPRDVLQVAFLVEQQENGPLTEVTKDGRTLIGQLTIQWRTTMGDSGYLSTGWLTTKRK